MNVVIFNSSGNVQPNVMMKGTPELTPVRMVLNGDPQDGGPNAPVNIAIQALLNQITYLRQKIKQLEETANNSQKVRLQISQDKPTDTSFAWLESDEEETVVDPNINITLEGGSTIPMLDSGIKYTVDGKAYTFVSGTGANYIEDEVTLPSGWLESVPAYLNTINVIQSPYIGSNGSLENVTINACNCEHSNLSVSEINQSIDNFFNTLEEGNDEDE